MLINPIRHSLVIAAISALALLVGCSAKEEAPQKKTTANPAYRSPAVSAPAVRNPQISLPDTLPRNIGVSHSRGKTSMPYIAMTYDDGPHPQNTPRLLDMLRERNIKATFYVVGKNVARYPAITRRIVAEGHEIGNHTWTHRKLTVLSDSQVRWEMDKTRDAIAAACGVKPRTMRPPYGALLQSQRAWIYKQYGYPTILWDVDPEDWKRPGLSVVTSRIVNGTRNGSIVLAHDLHKSTVDAMPATLDGLLRKGFKFVTVSQLLALNPKTATAPGSTNTESESLAEAGSGETPLPPVTVTPVSTVLTTP